MDNKQINKLIAEKVMGYKVVNEEYSVVSKGKFPEEFIPSAYIQDAWEVVEKLKGNHFSLHIINNKYIATFDDADYEADSPELAICMAALLSVGISI